MTFTAMGDSAPWPGGLVGAFQAGLAGVALSVLLALYGGLRRAFRRRVARGWIVGTGVLFLASLASLALAFFLTNSMTSTETVR